jgi:hypothetical protein
MNKSKDEELQSLSEDIWPQSPRSFHQLLTDFSISPDNIKDLGSFNNKSLKHANLLLATFCALTKSDTWPTVQAEWKVLGCSTGRDLYAKLQNKSSVITLFFILNYCTRYKNFPFEIGNDVSLNDLLKLSEEIVQIHDRKTIAGYFTAFAIAIQRRTKVEILNSISANLEDWEIENVYNKIKNT